MHELYLVFRIFLFMILNFFSVVFVTQKLFWLDPHGSVSCVTNGFKL